MHRLTVTNDAVLLDGRKIVGATQLVIHIDDGRSFAHITVPVELDLDRDIDRVNVVSDDMAHPMRG